MTDAPHKDCRLCSQLVRTRQWNIAQLQNRIDLLNMEIAEISRGIRHTAYHHAQQGQP